MNGKNSIMFKPQVPAFLIYIQIKLLLKTFKMYNKDNSDDEWCEVEERQSGVTDTLLQQPDITEDFAKILSFAPGANRLMMKLTI